MTSPLMDSTHSRTASSVARHHRLWTAHMSNDVGLAMPSLPLDSTHSRTTSSVACHHRLWGAQMLERRPAWHAIITFGLAHIVRQRRAWHVIIALRQKMRSNDVGRSMPSSSLSSTHGRTTSGVASHHRLCTTLTIERRPAWHAIIAFEKHTRSDDVRRGMPS